MVESYGNYKVSRPWVKVVLSNIFIPEVNSKHPGSRICAPEPLCFFSCALDETSHNHKRCLKQWHWLLHLSCWQWGPDAWTVRRALLSVSLNASCLSAAEEPDSSSVIHTWREILWWAISHIEITGKWLISCHFLINAESKSLILSALTWELIPQTPSMLLNGSRQQTPHWNSPSASAQRFPEEETCRFIIN